MKLTANGKQYELGELNLGEFRLLKRHFGVDNMAAIHPGDPDVLVGLVVVAMLRDNPERDVEDAVREVEALSSIEIDADEDDESDPTSADSQESSSATGQSDSDGDSAGSS